MKFTRLEIPDIILIEPKVFEDSRGMFFEFYHQLEFQKNGILPMFVQDNHSLSNRGILRGLHYQIDSKAQAKLVRVTRGEVYDVVVDIRKKSKTFGQSLGVHLSSENKKMLYIPIGFAHGYLVLKDETEFQYKVSSFYSPIHERGVVWNDPDLKIEWPDLGMDFVISDKDRKLPKLKEI